MVWLTGVTARKTEGVPGSAVPGKEPTMLFQTAWDWPMLFGSPVLRW